MSSSPNQRRNNSFWWYVASFVGLGLTLALVLRPKPTQNSVGERPPTDVTAAYQPTAWDYQNLDLEALESRVRGLQLWVKTKVRRRDAPVIGVNAESRDGFHIDVFLDCREDVALRRREAVAVVKHGASAVSEGPRCTLRVDAYTSADNRPARLKARSTLSELGAVETQLIPNKEN